MGEALRRRKFIATGKFTFIKHSRARDDVRTVLLEAVRMLLFALMIPIMASAPEVASSTPITVVGHAWAPFISPMGEPFRARTRSDDTLALWFNQADRNRDGVLAPDEMRADADRFFAKLDSNHDGQIDPDELVHYEWELAPEIQVNSRSRPNPGEASAKTQKGKVDRGHRRENDPDEEGARLIRGRLDGRLEGGARYSLLNIPEPVAAADTDFNRAITAGEFRQAAVNRFQILDGKRQGQLTFQDVNALRNAAQSRRPKRGKDAVDTRYGVPLPPGN